MVTVNGTPVEAAGMNLARYLEQAGYQKNYIAVERNGDIVPRDTYAQTTLEEGDVVEVVQFVGGG